MKPFENVEVGDKVRCLSEGDGIVDIVGNTCIYVRFPHHIGTIAYTFEGKITTTSKNRILFYVDVDGKSSNDRPVDTIDSSLVPVDTKVQVRDDSSYPLRNRHFAKKNEAFDAGKTSWTRENDDTIYWSHIYLAEELTKYGVVYPIGTRVI